MIRITEKQRQKRNIVYHSLRHSFVTACRVAGLSDFEVMSMSRHKDVKMLARYSHGKEAIDLPALREKIDNSFGAVAAPPG
jgi:integrase